MELAGARIRKARWNPGARTFELLLRVGGTGLEGGTDVLLRYRNVERLEPALPALAALVEDPAVRIAGARLAEGGGGWHHRFELVPAATLSVLCAAVETHESPVPGRDWLDTGYRFEILSC